MKNIINNTKHIAHEHLKGFGFADEQITPLVEMGIKNLTETLTNLKILLDDESLSLEKLDDALHAIKGLLLQLGNADLAEALNAIRLDLSNPNTVTSISKLFFDNTEK
ncbi:MAG: hypothetical protein U9O24_04525 [Campylobacterota bacterium]|nr:hypothetical protein [Campylobacterota bacterium]